MAAIANLKEIKSQAMNSNRDQIILEMAERANDPRIHPLNFMADEVIRSTKNET